MASWWLTVMAPGQVIRVEDLPPELRGAAAGREEGRWETSLKQYVEHRLMRGEGKIYRDVNDSFERILIQAALKYTGGRKQEAAKKLGWGRNTLTRKLKELGLDA